MGNEIGAPVKVDDGEPMGNKSLSLAKPRPKAKRRSQKIVVGLPQGQPFKPALNMSEVKMDTFEKHATNTNGEWFNNQDLGEDPELEIRDRVLQELGFAECTSRVREPGIELKYLQERIIREIKINPLLGRLDGSLSLRIIRDMTKELDKKFPERYRFEILVRNRRL